MSIHTDWSGWRVLRTHLQNEMRQSKFLVAQEFSFCEEYILWHMAKQYINHGEGFQTAGELVCALEEAEENVNPQHKLYDVICSIILDDDPKSSSFKNMYDEKKQKTYIKDVNQTCSTSIEKPDVETLRKETMKLWVERLCRNCHQNNFDYMMLDCCCLGLCESCSKTCRICPICRHPIRQLIHVFL